MLQRWVKVLLNQQLSSHHPISHAVENKEPDHAASNATSASATEHFSQPIFSSLRVSTPLHFYLLD
jgi:hypothetical protein